MTTVDLRLGDCLELMKSIPSGSVDAVVTDPPYSEKTHLGARSTVYGSIERGVVAIDFESCTADFVRKALSFCHPKRWCISFIDWRHALLLEQQPPDDLEFIRLGIWTKKNPMPQLTGDRPSTGWESIAIFHPPGKKYWNGGGGPAVWNNGTSRWGYFGPSNHPTEKPLSLMTKLILQFTDLGETILDPFMGSGTTGVACVQTGRNFIGIEISEEYFKIAKQRIETAQLQPNLFQEVQS